MRVLINSNELNSHLAKVSRQGLLADTGFLYAVTHDDDRLHLKANEILDRLVELQIPLYVNVVSRMEFIDLIFRKIVTESALKIFNDKRRDITDTNFFNFLKDIRDKDAIAKKNGQSYKVEERKLKKFRKHLESIDPEMGWIDFCETHLNEILFNEWKILEEDLGLQFVEIMEGASSALFKKNLSWDDMARIMAQEGLRAADAMILNLFATSHFPAMITTDQDFRYSIGSFDLSDKSVLILN